MNKTESKIIERLNNMGRPITVMGKREVSAARKLEDKGLVKFLPTGEWYIDRKGRRQFSTQGRVSAG